MISNHMSPFLAMIAWEFAQLSTLVKMGTNDWPSPRFTSPRFTSPVQSSPVLLIQYAVADRSLSTAKISLFPSVYWHDCIDSVVQSQSRFLRVDKVQTHSRSRKALKDTRMKSRSKQTLRIHAAFIR